MRKEREQIQGGIKIGWLPHIIITLVTGAMKHYGLILRWEINILHFPVIESFLVPSRLPLQFNAMVGLR